MKPVIEVVAAFTNHHFAGCRTAWVDDEVVRSDRKLDQCSRIGGRSCLGADFRIKKAARRRLAVMFFKIFCLSFPDRIGVHFYRTRFFVSLKLAGLAH